MSGGVDSAVAAPMNHMPMVGKITFRIIVGWILLAYNTLKLGYINVINEIMKQKFLQGNKYM
jgi:hypothetical protein